MRRQRVRAACPHPPADKAEAGAAGGVETKHGMQKQAPGAALLDLAKIAPVIRRRREPDLAGVLQGQHMPALHRMPRRLAPARDDPLHRHRLVAEQATEPDLLRMAAPRKPAKAHRFAQHDTFQKRRPPLSRRRSLNLPSVHPWLDCMPDAPQKQNARQNHTTYTAGIRPQTTESIRRTAMCICLSCGEGLGVGVPSYAIALGGF
jgi:hypothetical protein